MACNYVYKTCAAVPTFRTGYTYVDKYIRTYVKLYVIKLKFNFKNNANL